MKLQVRLTTLESRGIIRKPEGRSGASSEKEASIGAKMSSEHVPTAFSSTPLQSWKRNHVTIPKEYLELFRSTFQMKTYLQEEDISRHNHVVPEMAHVFQSNHLHKLCNASKKPRVNIKQHH